MHRAAAAQSELRVGRVAAARSTPDYAALAVMNTILGGTFVSRINSKLREEKGFTYGVRSTFDYRREPGPFAVQTSVQASATTEAIADILTEIRGIGGDRPATAAEIARAQAALTRSYPRSFETAEQVTRAVAQIALHGLPDDYFDGFVRDVSRVTAEQVSDVARRYAAPDDLHVVVVGDRSPPGGRHARARPRRRAAAVRRLSRRRRQGRAGTRYHPGVRAPFRTVTNHPGGSCV